MKIIPLSEGAFTVDGTKVFQPFDTSKDRLADRGAGSLLVEVQPFLVITDNDILLLDAGLGFVNDDGTPQLHHLMMDKGINPSEVTKVLMSHLHKDHSGGLALPDTNTPAFPNARYFVQRQELEFALSNQSSSYKTQELLCLKDNPKVELLEGEGNIDGYIRFQLTSAHSKYHQVFWIEEDKKIIFFGGDDAPQLSQMKSRYVAKYDFDGKKCMQLRQQWWAEGAEKHWTFLFYHDIKNPVVEK